MSVKVALGKSTSSFLSGLGLGDYWSPKTSHYIKILYLHWVCFFCTIVRFSDDNSVMEFSTFTGCWALWVTSYFSKNGTNRGKILRIILGKGPKLTGSRRALSSFSKLNFKYFVWTSYVAPQIPCSDEVLVGSAFPSFLPFFGSLSLSTPLSPSSLGRAVAGAAADDVVVARSSFFAAES